MGKKTRGAAKGQSRPSSSASNSSPSAIERNDLTSIVLNSMEAAADKMGLCEDEKTKYLSCARILVIEVVHADGCHEDMVAIFGDELECYL